MESKTSIFELSEIDKEFKEFYYQELVYLGQQTGIGADKHVPFEYDEILDYIDENGYPELDNNLAEKVKEYMKIVCGVNVELKDIKNKWLSDDKGIFELIRIRNVLPEWWNYIYSEEKLCKIYFIEAKINEQRLGGVFVFANPLKYDYIVFQGISKYIIPALAYALYPNCQVHKLNSLLQNSIDVLASINKANRIYVKPLPPQDNILKKYYGFKFIFDNREYYTCESIHKAIGTWMYKNVVK